jgi:hypothetical protein
MEEIRLGGGTEPELAIACAGRYPNGEAEWLWFTVRSSGLTATQAVWAHRWIGLADYFAALESDWRGWSAERIYESTENDLRLTATHDGHVWLHIELRHERDALPQRPRGWSAQTWLRLDPGEQLSDASRGIRAVVEASG